MSADEYVQPESYSVKQIREAFTKHARSDEWGVPSFYEAGLIAALRGKYDAGPTACGAGGPREASSDCVRPSGHTGEHEDTVGGSWPVAENPRFTPPEPSAGDA